MPDKEEIIAKVDEIVGSKKLLRKDIERLLDEIRTQVVKEMMARWKQR